MFAVHTSDHYSPLGPMILVSFPEAENNPVKDAAATILDYCWTSTYEVSLAGETF